MRDSDPAWIATLAEEVRAREDRESWTTDTDLLALTVNLLSLLRIEQLGIAGVKGRNLPKPISVRRPGAPEPEEDKPMSMGKFARFLMGEA